MDRKSDFCFIIGCHDRVEELLCHLEILKFFPLPYDVIITYSGDKPIDDNPLVKESFLVRTEATPQSKPRGAALAWCRGLVEAKKRCFDWCCYRNCDDWLFNQDQVVYTLGFLKNTPNKVAGYNWFKEKVFDNLALNELFMQMSILDKVDLLDWCSDLNKNVHSQCEYCVADKVFSVIRHEEFYRLWEREDGRGVGNCTNIPGPNNRFFNEYWLMLGHHNMQEKRRVYRAIRNKIPYRESLELMPNFRSWAAGPC